MRHRAQLILGLNSNFLKTLSPVFLELLTSDPPTPTSQSAGITGVSHHLALSPVLNTVLELHASGREKIVVGFEIRYYL